MKYEAHKGVDETTKKQQERVSFYENRIKGLQQAKNQNEDKDKGRK